MIPFRTRSFFSCPPGSDGRSSHHVTEHLSRRSFVASIVGGALIGPLLAAANIYMGLKVGFTSDGSLVAAIVAVANVRALDQLCRWGVTSRHTNIVQTAASAGAFCAVAGLTNAIPAMALRGVETDLYLLPFWVLFLAALGVCIAVPLRRRALADERLRFPSGVACAEAIRALHVKRGEASRGAWALGLSFLGAGLVTWVRDAGLPFFGKLIPGKTSFPGSIGGLSSSTLGLGVAWSPALCAIGALVGLRVATSLVIGAGLSFVVAGPWLHEAGVVEVTRYRSVVDWTVWPAVGLITAGGLGALIAGAGMVRRALSPSLPTEEARDTSVTAEEDDDVPRLWWIGGLVVATAGSALVARVAFNVPIWQSVVAVIIAFPLAAVAIRAVGETDMSPSNNLAKVTQFIFAGLAPGQAVSNVAAAGVTSGCAIEATEVMTDYKAGALLGNRPRDQFIAQLAGVATGAIGAVIAYSLLVEALPLGSEELPAPTARAWATLAAGLSGEEGALLPGAAMAAWIAAGVGLALGVVTSRWRKLPIPSPVAVGLGAIFPAAYSVTILLGAVIAALIARATPSWWLKMQFLVPSGLIVGESLIGLLAATLSLTGVL